MVDISPSAVKEIQRIQLNRETTNSFLRLSVSPGGCSGWYYQLRLENTHVPTSSQEQVLEVGNITVLVDANSWKYIGDLKLDYSEDLMGGGFRFHNPKVKNICGCGISFAITKEK